MNGSILYTKLRKTEEKTNNRNFWLYEKKRVNKTMTRAELDWVTNTDTLVPNIDSSGPTVREKDIEKSKNMVLQTYQGNKEEKKKKCKNTMILLLFCLFVLLDTANERSKDDACSLLFIIPHVSHQAL